MEQLWIHGSRVGTGEDEVAIEVGGLKSELDL